MRNLDIVKVIIKKMPKLYVQAFYQQNKCAINHYLFVNMIQLFCLGSVL